MDVVAELSHLKAKTLEEIAEVAKTGNAAGVLEAGSRLQAIEELSAQHDRWLKNVGDLLDGNWSSNDFPQIGPPGDRSARSPRAYGKQRRNEFLDQMNDSGVILRPDHGTIYLAPNGSRVGIPFATETSRNKWFLGLPEGAFDQALLLCESHGAGTTALSLGKAFLTKYSGSLSLSKGQYKFNVARRGSSFYIAIPGIGEIQVDRLNNRDLVA